MGKQKFYKSNIKKEKLELNSSFTHHIKARPKNSGLTSLIFKLGLENYLNDFLEFFARNRDFDELKLNGDIARNHKIIKELDPLNIKAPPKIKNFNSIFLQLQLNSTLALDDLHQIAILSDYLMALKDYNFPSNSTISNIFNELKIPKIMCEIADHFDLQYQEPTIKEGKNQNLDSINLALQSANEQLAVVLKKELARPILAPYLVDYQLHFINEVQTLLLRGGFSSVIEGNIISRTSSGFFYVLPKTSTTLLNNIDRLRQKKQLLLMELCDKLSTELKDEIENFRIIDKFFDSFDGLIARVNFAKTYNLEFLNANSFNSKIINIIDFYNPTIKNPKPISINFADKNLLIISGVNAGGKTMLLKSIVSVALLAKLLIPMKINTNSKISNFKNIDLIINDPQDNKNDISSFAGRMLEISKIFDKDDLLLGIDEIELGTDSNEASALYKVILETLLNKNIKIIITTHHKRLCAMLAGNSEVLLCAAIFDEIKMLPTYEYIFGVIGRSYAFETAMRYGIPKHLVKNAMCEMEEDNQNLDKLIISTTNLEIALKKKNIEQEKLTEEIKKEREKLEELKNKLELDYKIKLHNAEKSYNEARDELKAVLKTQNIAKINQSLNATHEKITKKTKKEGSEEEIQIVNYDFAIGNRVKRGKSSGTIEGINDKYIIVELDNGVKIRAQKSELRPTSASNASSKITLQTKKEGLSPTLDLHGLRGEEAIEQLHNFINNSLIAGFDEVLIKHGIGSGILAKLVSEELKNHKKVISFSDAPATMGGFGAKIVKL